MRPVTLCYLLCLACLLLVGLVASASAMPADNLPGPSTPCSPNGGGCLLGPPIKV